MLLTGQARAIFVVSSEVAATVINRHLLAFFDPPGRLKADLPFGKDEPRAIGIVVVVDETGGPTDDQLRLGDLDPNNAGGRQFSGGPLLCLPSAASFHRKLELCGLLAL